MTNTRSVWLEGQEEGFLVRVGERIRITRGVLGGASGVVAGHNSNSQYVVIIDGWPEGVHLLVNRQTIEQVDDPD
jgi:hypothetical protein